jgi:tetratricopeptide (TPR) repeat protein
VQANVARVAGGARQVLVAREGPGALVFVRPDWDPRSPCPAGFVFDDAGCSPEAACPTGQVDDEGGCTIRKPEPRASIAWQRLDQLIIFELRVLYGRLADPDSLFDLALILWADAEAGWSRCRALEHATPDVACADQAAAWHEWRLAAALAVLERGTLANDHAEFFEALIRHDRDPLAPDRFADVARAHPDSPYAAHALYRAGNAALARPDVPRALDLYEQALALSELDPHLRPLVVHAHAQAWWLHGDVGKAYEGLTRVVRDGATKPELRQEALRKLAQIHPHHGPPEGLVDFFLALSQDDHLALELSLVVARGYVDLDRWDEAEPVAEQLITLTSDPDILAGAYEILLQGFSDPRFADRYQSATKFAESTEGDAAKRIFDLLTRIDTFLREFEQQERLILSPP